MTGRALGWAWSVLNACVQANASYKEKLQSGAQTKLNSTVAGVDQRTQLFDEIMDRVEQTTMNHTQVPSSFAQQEAAAATPLVVTRAEVGLFGGGADSDADGDQSELGERLACRLVGGHPGAPGEVQVPVLMSLKNVCRMCVIAKAYAANSNSLKGLTTESCIRQVQDDLPTYKVGGCSRKKCIHDIRSSLSEEDRRIELNLRSHFPRYDKDKLK